MCLRTTYHYQPCGHTRSGLPIKCGQHLYLYNLPKTISATTMNYHLSTKKLTAIDRAHLARLCAAERRLKPQRQIKGWKCPMCYSKKADEMEGGPRGTTLSRYRLQWEGKKRVEV